MASDGRLSDQGFDLGERRSDRVKIVGVGRPEKEPGTDVFQDLGSLHMKWLTH